MTVRSLITVALALTLSVLTVGCDALGLSAQPSNPYPPAEYDNLIDKSLLTGDPCAPPCWYDINPGDSREQSLRKLEEVPFVDSSSFRLEDHRIMWSDTVPNKGGSGILEFYRNQLTTINFFPQYPLTLKEMIEIFGEPDGTRVTAFPSSRGVDVVLDVYWPHKGISGEVILPDMPLSDDLPTEDSLIIDLVIYFKPQDTIQDVFKATIPQIPLESLVQEYYSWDEYNPLNEP